MDRSVMEFWWLLFPMMWLGLVAFKSWLRYRRHRDLMDVVRAYANQGREPPPEILARLADPSLAEPERPWRQGSMAWWFPGIILLSFAAAFAALSILPDFAGYRFVPPAVFMAVLGGAWLLGALISKRLARTGGGDGR